MNRLRPLLAASTALLLSVGSLSAQSAPRAGLKDTTPGFPIHEPAIILACAGCHVRDSTGIMQRLSYLRKTVEGWEASVRRMVSLHNVTLEPAAARTIVRYLANHQGLAPAEVRLGQFDAERRMTEFNYTASPPTEQTCRACHSMGRVVLQRRTGDEWTHLTNTHRALYPNVDFQSFRRGGPPPPDSAGAPQPVDAAVSHLSRAFPLRTPEWAAWEASMRAPRIEGSWLVSGNEPGRGRFFGRLTVTKSPTADDEFVTRASYRYANGGAVATREGRSVVYTGFQWRGRSNETGAPADAAMREVLIVEPGWQQMSGRWFRGGYDEFGMDVTLTRLGGGPVLAGVSQRGLRRGESQDLTLFGANLPRDVAAAAVDFGPGVRVERVVRAAGDSVTVRVRVDAAATIGTRDLFVAGASLAAAVVVYDELNRIKVLPLAGLARTGGREIPKQHQQFDAYGYLNGVDGKPETADDIELGRVDVAWSLEEYATLYNDDDLKFIGTLDARGLFTPEVDGPNPLRSGNRNNIGDLWAVASYQPKKPGAAPIKSRAHLVSTVPLYIRFDPWRGVP